MGVCVQGREASEWEARLFHDEVRRKEQLRRRDSSEAQNVSAYQVQTLHTQDSQSQILQAWHTQDIYSQILQTWHTQVGQSQILVLAFRHKFSPPCKLFPFCLEAGTFDTRLKEQQRAKDSSEAQNVSAYQVRCPPQFCLSPP